MCSRSSPTCGNFALEFAATVGITASNRQYCHADTQPAADLKVGGYGIGITGDISFVDAAGVTVPIVPMPSAAYITSNNKFVDKDYCGVFRHSLWMISSHVWTLTILLMLQHAAISVGKTNYGLLFLHNAHVSNTGYVFQSRLPTTNQMTDKWPQKLKLFASVRSINGPPMRSISNAKSRIAEQCRQW